MISEVTMYFINGALVMLVFGALYTDVKSRRIPNWQTVPAIGLGIVLNVLYAGQSGLLASLGGGLIGAALLLLPYILGGMGAGDVKLLMAIGALKGWPFILWTAGYAALIGGVIGIVIVVKRRSVLRLFRYLLNPLVLQTIITVPYFDPYRDVRYEPVFMTKSTSQFGRSCIYSAALDGAASFPKGRETGESFGALALRRGHRIGYAGGLVPAVLALMLIIPSQRSDA